MKRRQFLGAAAFGAVLPAAAAASPAPVPEARFPAGFWWGTATAAYQLEGAVAADGRKPSIWDTFSHTAGKVVGGDSGDVACDHYHRFEEDVRSMAELGVRHYRFSISWPRILPEGRGSVNQKGLDFYRRLVDALLEHGITPHATLYHWDLPQALQDRYAGWQSREIVEDFGNYASVVAKNLGDRVTHWMTLNEIATFCIYCGYGVKEPGSHAPGLAVSAAELWQITHHALLAHGRACQAIRASSPVKCSVGIAENFESYAPVIESPEHIAAARLAFTQTEVNGAIITPLLTGHYDPVWLTERGKDAPRVREGDMKLISQPLDALGFNCYTGGYVRAHPKDGYEILDFFDNYPKLNMPWLNMVPEVIYWGIRMIGDALKKPNLPIFISENGCADGATAAANGVVNDIDRIMYLRQYLRQVQRAMADGCPVIGYFPWSLMDNFEWGWGYSKRFGLMHVDYKTQKRTPKLSYHWYQAVIRNNRVM